MVDSDLIDALPEHEQVNVRVAIATLASSGILMAQSTRMFQRLLEGDESEDPDALRDSILRYRKETHGLKGLHNLGLHYLKEMNNA